MAAREDVVVAERGSAGGAWLPALALAGIAGLAYAIRLDLPPFFDNEGRYAGVAREMLLGGDWVTPRMDGTLFLNKPPLTYWLTAAAFRAFGLTEWARLSSVILAMGTLLATCRLGARLFGERTGLLAGAFLATAVGFVLEARTLRPDSVLIAVVTLALLCWHHADDPATPEPTPWLVALYGALGLGMLAKGAVPVVVVAIPIAFVTLRERGLTGLRRLRPGLGLAVLAAVVLPWHVAVSWRHPGFAWDYVVNQHLLFFLDRKFPRDSEGDPLAVFWGALACRSLPWVVLLPFSLREALAGLGGGAGPRARGSLLVWAWLAGLMGFFSLAPSRLEHYSLPAMPAVALLAARGADRLIARELGWRTFGYLAVLGALAAAGGVACLVSGARLLDDVYWIGQVPTLPGLTFPGGLLLLAGGAAVAWAAIVRRPGATIGAILALAVPIAGLVTYAQTVAAPIFSWGPLAAVVRAQVPPDVEIVFEGPEEYQIVGGLGFYTERHITLLEVPGFVPPTYLEAEARTMFLSRADLARRWQSGERLAFVTNPQRRNDTVDGLVPAPVHVVARFGDRWLLTNFPAGAPASPPS